MSLVSLSIDNLINGVSQQPASQRQPSQCEVQENCFDSVSSGCSKRPPRDHVKTLSTTNLGHLTNVFSQFLDLGDNGQYILTVANGVARLFDLDGDEQTLTYTYTAADGDYLQLYNGATSYPESFKAYAIGESALLLNTSRTVIATGESEAEATSDRYLVSIKEGNYSTNYKITIQNCVDGVVTNYVSSKTTSDTVISDLRTSGIADDLLDGFAPALPGSITATRNESSIYFIRSNTDANNWMRVTVSDSRGDSRDQTNIGCFSTTIQRFTDLPIVGHTEFDQVKIIGEDASLATPYYVKFVPNNTNTDFGRGVWVETVYRGVNRNNAYQLGRMPYQLTRISEGNFTLAAAAWGSRTAGDTTSAPFPPFVDTQINDLFLYKNRLCFLSKDHISFSRHGQDQILNFFPSTVTLLLDTGPIVDLKALENTGRLEHGVPYDDTLILFSEKAQLTITDDDLLSPKSIPGINKKADFASSHMVRPVVAAKSIYFPFSVGRFSGVQEFYIDNVSSTADASEITAHVKKYIEGDIIKMCASTRNNIMVALGSTDKSKLFIYQWYWSGDTKLQSAWHDWPLEDGVTVLDIFFYQHKLYLVVQRDDITLDDESVVSGGCHLETVDISEGQWDD